MGQIATPMSTVKLADPINSTRPMGRILVVEDDPAVQKALKRLFESEGYSVEVQGNGRVCARELSGCSAGRYHS